MVCQHTIRSAASRAFTLIELLVVVALLSILIALLFPVVNTARVAAGNAVCRSNLRQLGSAIQLYQRDFDGYFPLAINFEDELYQDNLGSLMRNDIDGLQRWKDLFWDQRVAHLVLQIYAPLSVWRCPADFGIYLQDPRGYDPLGHGASCFERFGSSYVYLSPLGAFEVNDADVENPADLPLLWDATGYWHTRYRRDLKVYENDADAKWESWQNTTLWADGHVGWASASAIEDAWASYATRLGIVPNTLQPAPDGP